jgi:hypothetical protein
MMMTTDTAVMTWRWMICRAVSAMCIYHPDAVRSLSLLLSCSFTFLTEGNYPSLTADLVLTFHQPDFHDLIQRFLFDQTHMDDVDAPAGSDIPLEQCPTFNSKISMYHSMVAVFYSPSDPCGLHGMHRETIHATPCWRKCNPWYDTVFVERDPTLVGI